MGSGVKNNSHHLCSSRCELATCMIQLRRWRWTGKLGIELYSLLFLEKYNGSNIPTTLFRWRAVYTVSVQKGFVFFASVSGVFCYGGQGWQGLFVPDGLSASCKWRGFAPHCPTEHPKIVVTTMSSINQVVLIQNGLQIWYAIGYPGWGSHGTVWALHGPREETAKHHLPKSKSET